MHHIMIDLETLDLVATAVVASIGIVEFDADGIKNEYYSTLDMDKQLQDDRTVDDSTLRWWLTGPHEEARQATFSGRTGDPISIPELHGLMQDIINFNTTIVWAAPAKFDIAILDHLFRYRSPLWYYRNVRCASTVMALYDRSWIESEVGVDFIPHSAVCDARRTAHTILQLNKKYPNIMAKSNQL